METSEPIARKSIGLPSERPKQVIPLHDHRQTPFLKFGGISMVLLFFAFFWLILIFIFMEYRRGQESHIQQIFVGIVPVFLSILIPLHDHRQALLLVFCSIFQPQCCRLVVKATTNEGRNCEWKPSNPYEESPLGHQVRGPNS